MVVDVRVPSHTHPKKTLLFKLAWAQVLDSIMYYTVAF